jgi:geranylgeranyl pyrophosphate synthase
MREARSIAVQYAHDAAAELRGLPESPARRTLEEVAHFVVARQA